MEIKLLLSRHPEVDGDFQEILLEVEAYKGEPMTRHCPGAPAWFEITDGWYAVGKQISWDLLKEIEEEYTDEIWELIYEQERRSLEL